MSEVEAPCPLDPKNPEHVSAVHEAGHAVAADRTGCRLTHTYLLVIAGVRSHGETQRHPRNDIDDEGLARVDRAIAVAGPAAELRFSGSTDADSCEHDNEVAHEITQLLEDEALDKVRENVEAALIDGDTWFAVLATACSLLGSMANVGPDPGSVHNALQQLLGPPVAPWPPVNGQGEGEGEGEGEG